MNIKTLFIFGILLHCAVLFSQNVSVRTSTDTLRTDIGLPISYTIEVETDSLYDIVFPKNENNTLGTFTIINSKTDTLNKKSLVSLKKIYELSNFESGIKVIPTQNVIVRDSLFKTDSLLIEINDMIVDTVSKKIYDIKPIVSVEEEIMLPWYILGVILSIILVLGVLTYFIFFRKKVLTEEEKIARLNPFERATYNLEKLRESKHLLYGDFKPYYTELTETFRRYINEDLKIDALESTSDELIEKLDQHEYTLNKNALQSLRTLLKNADLVKFAQFSPESHIAYKDLDFIKNTIDSIKALLPEELTQEEIVKVKDEEKRKQKKKVLYTSVIFTTIVIIGIVIWMLIPENHLKNISEKEWYTSQYDFPPTTIQTPEILKRLESPSNIALFTYGSVHNALFISLEHYKNLSSKDSLKGQEIIENRLDYIEKQGGSNITNKQQEYTSQSGEKGTKIYGNFIIKRKSGNNYNKSYSMFVFNENGIIQNLTIIYNNDKMYGSEIENRIQSSLTFKTK